MFASAKPHSGPGLTINTASANALSSAPSQAGGLFPPIQQTKQNTGLFGSSLGTSQSQQNSTLLGAPAPSMGRGLFSQGANNQQQAAGSLLGGLSSQPAGNLFPPQPNQPQRTTLSGAAVGQQTQHQSATAGLFGTPQAQPQHQSATAGLFGTQQAQPQQQSVNAGFFGTQQAQPQQGGGFFTSLGQKQPQGQAQQPQGGLLGSFSQNRAPSIFQNTTNQHQASTQQPASIFATSIGQYSQQHQTIPGVRISINELRPTTRFNDLHEELQKQIEEIDNFILGQMKYQGECEVLISNVDQRSSPIPDDVEYCAKTLETLQIALENDAEAIALAKTFVTTDSANAKLSFDVIQALKMPQQFHHFALWSGQNSSHTGERPLMKENEATPSKNLVSYFSQAADHMSQILSKYKGNITEVETYLRGLEVNLGQQVQQMAFVRGRDGGAQKTDDQIRELAAVLREFETGILGVAGKVGSTREKVQELSLGDLGNGGRARRY